MTVAINSWPPLLCSFRTRLQQLRLYRLAWLGLFLSLGSQAEPAAPRADALAGSYLQLHQGHQTWSPAQWRALFNSFESLGLRRVIVQWSRYESTSFQNPGPAGQAAVLSQLLALAAEKNMRLHMGLASRRDYWQAIARPLPEVASYLSALRTRSLLQAYTLAPALNGHPAFAGWYISEEVDDINWREPAARLLLQAHLRELSQELAQLSPGAGIAISGFSNAEQTPEELANFWQALLQAAPAIDELLFQDGIGVFKQDLRSLPPYVAALAAVCQRQDRAFHLVVETFSQTAGAPLDQQDFKAIPAAMPRLQAQLNLAARFGGGAIAFSVPEYLSPQGGDAAQALYERYLHYLASPAVTSAE